MKMKIRDCIFLCAIFAQPSWAHMQKEVVASGEVYEISDENVRIKDSLGQILIIPKINFDQSQKIKTGNQVSAPMPVMAENFFAHKEFDLRLPKNLKDQKVWNKILFAHYRFLYLLNKKMKFPEDASRKRAETGFFKNGFDKVVGFFNSQFDAFAVEENFRCFYSGWPTTVGTGGACTSPWSASGLPVSNYRRCGGDDSYRCNPTLFGPGEPLPEGSTSTTGLGTAQVVPGTGVRVYPQTDTAAGLCVKTTVVDQILPLCIQATRGRLGLLIQRLAVPDSQERAQFERYHRSVVEFCGGSRNSSNAVCLILQNFLADLRFGTSEEKRVCRILENNPTAAAGQCRRVKLHCQQGGLSVIGFVSGDHLNSVPVPSELPAGGRLPESQIAGLGDLVSTPCGSTAMVFGENCITQSAANLHTDFATGGVPGCAGNVCSVYAQCSAPTESAAADTVVSNILLSCDCSQIGGPNPDVANLTYEHLRNCKEQKLNEITLQNATDFIPSSPSGGGLGH